MSEGTGRSTLRVGGRDMKAYWRHSAIRAGSCVLPPAFTSAASNSSATPLELSSEYSGFSSLWTTPEINAPCRPPRTDISCDAPVCLLPNGRCPSVLVSVQSGVIFAYRSTDWDPLSNLNVSTGRVASGRSPKESKWVITPVPTQSPSPRADRSYSKAVNSLPGCPPALGHQPKADTSQLRAACHCCYRSIEGGRTLTEQRSLS